MIDTAPFVEMAKAFARMSHYGVYLLDKVSGKFLYVSENTLLRCGMEEEMFTECGVEVMENLLSEHDRDLMHNAFDTAAEKYKEIPNDQKPNFVAYFNFHTLYQNRPMMVTHKLSVLADDKHGRPYLVLGLVTPSIHDHAGSILVRLTGTDKVYRYIPENRSWETEKQVKLTENELTMLRLTIQGHSLEVIGRMMFKSTESVKYYRRQVYEKLGVKNISEALAYVADYGLL